MNPPEASEVTVRVIVAAARFRNSIVANPWTFPPTNVLPRRVPDGYAVRLNPRRLVEPRDARAGRVARSPEDAEIS